MPPFRRFADSQEYPRTAIREMRGLKELAFLFAGCGALSGGCGIGRRRCQGGYVREHEMEGCGNRPRARRCIVVVPGGIGQGGSVCPPAKVLIEVSDAVVDTVRDPPVRQGSPIRAVKRP
jgi:hypothetical protein